ncbi:YadA-like family protein [Paraburkholderia sp. LEh10]|uniref:ESPR-type extended signal peptide-containing protein n=1 Tax=Paraburkholderia sp. LEh10 TaxID=2821353 RepID=UPI001AE51550|nr:ESPR-type extended signal peptide-containing protein [Paraburkholderia sp. LEh10]MBP0592547.1 YadA-like family protein [Paraburkholderia sp. LEh10]
MNKIYKSVWCDKTGTYVAASEHTHAKGKKSRNTRHLVTALALGGAGSVALAGGLDGGSATGANGAIAYGATARSSGIGSIAIGNAGSFAATTVANNTDSLAIGNGATASAEGTTVLGVGSTATGDSGVGIGSGARSLASDTIAIGHNAYATVSSALALGSYSSAYGANSVAIGASSIADRSNSVSVGSSSLQRQITNVAAGTASTDAVNISQLMAEDARVNNLSNVVNNVGSTGTVKYFHASSTATDSLASGPNSIAVGPQALASNSYGIAMGPLATASGVSGIAIGAASLSTAQQSDAFGDYATASGLYSVALGNQSTASAQSALAIGDTAIASGTSATAIGQLATAIGANSVALGAKSVANSATLGTAGFNPGGSAINASANVGEVSIGSANAERRITNVAAGYSATDAVNVSQLMSENAKVNLQGTNTAAALGGGASYNPSTGAVTNPAYNVAGGTYNNVAGALTGIDARINNISPAGSIKYFHANSALADSSAAGAESIAVGGAANATASNAVALGSNSVAERANTVSVGSATLQRQITNMAAGTAATDAVNVSQLGGVTTAIGGGASVKADGSIAQPMFNVYGNTFSNVGDALASISDSTSNIVQNLKYISFGAASGQAAKANATGLDAIAIGPNAVASKNGAVAIGRASFATGTNSVALGYGSQATADNTFAVGNAFSTRRIVNVADGVAATDAATVGQVNSDIQAAIANLNTTSSSTLKSSSLRATSLLGAAPSPSMLGGPPVSSLTPDQLIAAGPTQLGGQLAALGTDSMAIGLNSQATADQAVSVGGNVQTLGLASVGIGQQIAIDGDHTVVMGTNVTAHGNNAIVIGNNSSSVVVDDGIAIGNNVQVGGPETMAIGKDIIASGSNSVTLGNGGDALAVDYDAAAKDAITLKGANGTKIANLTAGALNASSTEAVNGSQLYAQGTSAAQALGGGASFNTSTGAITRPQYTLSGSTFSNVGDALTALDSVAKSGNVLGVVYDGTAKDQITLAGANGTTITKLAAGAVNASSSDAVNGTQLYNVAASTAGAIGGGSSFDPTTGTITNPTYVIGGSTVTNISGAITSIDARVTTDISNLTTQIYNGEIGLVQQDASTNVITVASQKSGSLVDFTGTAGARVLTGVAAGKVNASSYDAINGTQLYNVAASTAGAIGGGSSFDPTTGTITNPTFVINNGTSTITNVAGAITNLDNRVYANSTDITNLQTQINGGGIGLVTQDATTSTILVASQTGGSVVDFTGTAGARRLTGVAAGKVNASSLDAVNGTQLYNVAASTAAAIGSGSTVNSNGTISNPTFIVGGSTVTTIGGAITNLDARLYANTTDITNLQTQINEGGIGIVTQDATSKNILVASQTNGSVVDFTGTAGARVLSGVAAGVAATDAVNVGQLQAAGIIGPNGQTKAAVTYDTKADGTTNYSSITLGDGTSNAAPVAIHNVADGSAPNDAVNYSQYSDLLGKVNKIVNAGTGVDTLFVGDGNRNTEAAQAGGTHATAMGALSVASGNQSIAAGYASKASGQNAVAIGSTSTASGNNSVALGAGSVADQDNTVSVGSATQQRRVTNVAAGTSDTDAVNVGQLNQAITQAGTTISQQAVQQANAYTDQQFNKMNDKMNSLGAAAMAATSLIPNARAEGNFQMSAAAGTYGGAAAIAIGANYWVNDRVLVNAHVTRSTGNSASTGASAGVTIGF